MPSRSPILDILFLFVLVYVLQLVASLLDIMAGIFVLSPPVTQDPWTIFTNVYAHANEGHLFSNAIAFVLFGTPVAAATTRVRFHVFFLSTGALAGLSQILLTDALASAPLVEATPTAGVLGASGAVFALLGYLLASNRISTGLGTLVDPPAWLTYLIFFVLAAVVTIATAAPGVALIAHFTGLFAGLVAGRYNVLARTGARNGR